MIPCDYNYTREKMRNTVYELAIGSGDVRSRLREAFSKCWILSEENFPKELRNDWSWIKKEMNKYGPRRNSEREVRVDAIDNTMSKIKNKTGVKIARKIYDLKCGIEDYIDSQNS